MDGAELTTETYGVFRLCLVELGSKVWPFIEPILCAQLTPRRSFGGYVLVFTSRSREFFIPPAASMFITVKFATQAQQGLFNVRLPVEKVCYYCCEMPVLEAGFERREKRTNLK